MSHTCALCGHIVFSTMHEYETHRAIYHGVKRSIKPEKVTGRSPAKIVSDAEATWLKPYLIVPDSPFTTVESFRGHLETCRCQECVNKRLDAIIALQEASLQGVTNA